MHKHLKMALTLSTFFSLCSAQINLPSIFSDNMVLQQHSEVAIWGWSKKDTPLQVTTSWDERTYTAQVNKNGEWKALVQTGKAGGPYTIAITGSENVFLKNVFLGEVWLCSGQSNMEMPMKGFPGQPVDGALNEIMHSKNPNIRLISVQRKSTSIPQKDFVGQWKEATPTSVSNFSATGYFFGNLLSEMLNVPIGLIDVSYSGSSIQAWMSAETAVPFEEYSIPKSDVDIKSINHTPTVLFNGMLNPIVGFGIKGCIWYQGETNYQEPDKYPQLMNTMVSEWRKLWQRDEFPFFYTQIAPFDYSRFTPNDAPDKFNTAYLREAQWKAQKMIPNSGCAVILDTGEESNIHPSKKKEAGERLALWALGKTYNLEGIHYEPPSYKAIEIKDSTIIVSFNQFNGLTSYGKEITLFEIAGKDQIFYPAQVTLRRKSVIVYAPEVKKPVAVRYAFKDFVQAELFDTYGLPVSSFRSDNW